MKIILTRKNRLQIAAILVILQGLAMGKFIISVDKTLDQAQYLADIVGRNLENLEEFDIIALKDLGILKEKS